MIRLLADENFNGKAVRQILRTQPDTDLIRVQDTALAGAPDPQVLEWAAREGRILLTHDFDTMVGYAYERVAAGLPMPGVFAAHESLAVGIIIKDVLTILGASDAHEWDNKVIVLPL